VLRTSSKVMSTSRETAEAAVLPGSGGGPLPPTCLATLLMGGVGSPPTTLARERELVEQVARLLMVIKSGTGGCGDETKEETIDVPVFETEGESKTGNGIIKKKEEKKKRISLHSQLMEYKFTFNS